MTIQEVMRFLPHRYPFLLVDRVTAVEPGKFLDAIKNVSINEPFFQGHFPVKPVMPGVLIVEAMAQATGLLAFKSQESVDPQKLLYLLVGIDEVRFRRQVEPGDQLLLHVELVRSVKGIWKFDAVARVGDEVAASAVLMCAGKET